MNFNSKYIDQAVAAFASMPGIGKKTALRLTLHLLKQSPEEVIKFSTAFTDMRNNIKFCKNCFHISDHDICSICNNEKRINTQICVVEGIRDVFAIENTMQYNGLYHVLGGVISPVDGIGPDELTIDALVNRITENETAELIMALNPTFEGDTTIFYISKKLQHLPIKITSIARGIAFGGELEYADELTLGRSIMTRTLYQVNS